MERACRIYRPRDPRKAALWGLLDTLCERVKGAWEERYERKYGYWRGLADEAVARYLDPCRRCPQEFLVAFSCKGRGLCPSCGAKRAAELAALLVGRRVGPGPVRGRASRRRAVPPQGAGAASAPGAAERGADRAAAVVERLLRSQPGRRPGGGARGKPLKPARGACPPSPERAALGRRWANLVRRVYEVDPLVCPRCGAEMRVIGFITEPKVITRILDHIRKRDRVSRPPPPSQPAVAHIA